MTPPFRPVRCWPLRALADGRRPTITSGFRTRNPSRPTHQGVDLFYRWKPSDGPVRVGDGGAARDRKTGQPKWFIPAGTMAVASAAGRVVRASRSPTGHIVWIDHRCGWFTGYMHLRGVVVRVGADVQLGDVLGEVGDNPRATDASHLHFETVTSLSGHPRGCRDPELWLQRAAVAQGGSTLPSDHASVAGGAL
jgi:murein DD-endopeptidase MepM/ murein hydrolase activator NlpD